jgi:signal transduction protein with GAF and PtsI domain
MLRLIAGAGPLAEVMTEFLLIEQPVRDGVNGRVARSGNTALVTDTGIDPDYIARDPQTDPRSELSVPIFVDGAVWGVLNIEAAAPEAFGEADAALVETVAASFGAAVHRAGLIADLKRTFTTTLAALTSTVEAKDNYTAAHERWDGGGYPDGLAGEQIPLAARIIAACDTYDAIITDRPARTPAQAREELRSVAGTQLDERAVAALLAELSSDG